VKVGFQRLKGQKRIEIAHCTQLWIDDTLFGVVGIWGDAVLTKTPIRIYTAMSRPFTLKSVFRKSTVTNILSVDARSLPTASPSVWN
jgi:hypothetical protein